MPIHRADAPRPPSSRSSNLRRRSKLNTLPPPSWRSFNGFCDVTSFLWSVAELLCGDYQPADYKVILPPTVLRRPEHGELKRPKHPDGTIEKMRLRRSGNSFYNVSKVEFAKLRGDVNSIAANLTSRIKEFSLTARDVIQQTISSRRRRISFRASLRSPLIAVRRAQNLPLASQRRILGKPISSSSVASRIVSNCVGSSHRRCSTAARLSNVDQMVNGA